MYTESRNFSRFTVRKVMVNWVTGHTHTWHHEDEFAADHLDKVRAEPGHDITLRVYGRTNGSSWLLTYEHNFKAP